MVFFIATTVMTTTQATTTQATTTQGASGAGAQTGSEIPITIVAAAVGGAVVAIALASTFCVVFILRRSMFLINFIVNHTST